MDYRKQYYALLKPLRRQLFVKKLITDMYYWLAAAGILSVLLILSARFYVIPYYCEMIIYSCIGLLLVFIVHTWIFRPSVKDAVLLFNDFVPDDQVITAFSFLGKDGLVEELQLQAAVSLMKKEQSRVLSRKKNALKPKWLFACGCLLLLAFLLGYFPNQTLLLAEKKEHELSVVKKIEKQLKDKINKEENPTAKKSLEEALKLAQKQNDPKKALEELAKQMKELELKALKEQEKQNTLHSWKEELQKNDLKDLATALGDKDMKKIKKELERLNKQFDSLTEGQKKSLGKLAGNTGQLSDQELAALQKMIEEGLNAENLQKELADAAQNISTEAANLQQTLENNGMPTKIAINPLNTSTNPQGKNQSGNKGNSNNGSTGQNPNSGNANSGTGKSDGNGKGNGTGNGKGNGNGSGNGNGTGKGNGKGAGNGSGKGAGLGMGSRDFLTVPEKIDGKNNVETDSGTTGEGTPAEQYAGNGPVLKGKIRSYQEVYGNYLESYRNSTDRVKLPSDLEEIVKNYYSSLDPNKE